MKRFAWLGIGPLVIGIASTLAVSSPAYAEPVDDGLRDAVQQDLGISWEDYLARGKAAEAASRVDDELQHLPGYYGVSLEGEKVVVSTDSAAISARARELGAEPRSPGRGSMPGPVDALAERYLAEVGPAGLVAVSASPEGWQIVVDGDPRQPREPRPGGLTATPGESAPTAGPEGPGSTAAPGSGGSGKSPAQFAAEHPGVRIIEGRPLERRAQIVRGGDGIVLNSTFCSAGFAAFSAAGRPEVLTAGHCTLDGKNTTAVLEKDRSVGLGRLVYNQFGGVNNSTNGPANPGYDLAIYSGVQETANLEGRVTTYNGVQPVTGMAKAVVGSSVCTSGRTTQRWQCGVVEDASGFFVPGYRDPVNDPRWVKGFRIKMTTQNGDSGGPVLAGLKAVGVLSAGGQIAGQEFSFGADLGGLTARGGSIKVWLNAPEAAPGAASTKVDGRIRLDDGTLPPGTKVQIRSSAGTQTVPVTAAGRFTFTAPAGTARMVAVSGHSRSAEYAWTNAYGSALGERACVLRDGGCLQRFVAGTAYQTNSGATSYLVRGRIMDRWGDYRWENGRLGYPISDERCGQRDGGCRQQFQGGAMYWSGPTDAHPVWGAIESRYHGAGGLGTFGYPLGEEYCGLRGGGCFQRFQGGSIYWSPATGAHWVRGAIADSWGRTAWENGPLGYPTSGEFCGLTEGGCAGRFQHGSIYWTPRTGAQPVRGAILGYWASTGWERGRFGYPVSAESCSNGVCRQRFAKGTITWSAATGARG